MTYKITVAVATEPVTLVEARLQCRVDSDDTSQDALLTAYITAAREYAEHHTGRALAPQTIEMALDEFPDYENDVIELDMPPVVSITSVKYTDTAGVEQTLAGSKYALSTYGLSRKLAPTFGNYWPSTQCIPDAVRIRYVCGADDIPKAVKSAMLLDIQMRYDKLTPAEADAYAKARDSLLDTVKVYGF